MSSPAEQLAASLNFGAFGSAEELKKRIWFTLGALLVFRLGTYIPCPGVEPAAASRLLEQQHAATALFDVVAGGALGRMSIFALGVLPYIIAITIAQRLRRWPRTAAASAAVPIPATDDVPDENVEKAAEALSEEADRSKPRSSYIYYLTVLVALPLAYLATQHIERASAGLGQIAPEIAPFMRAAMMITFVAGALFVGWLSEQITARGIGDGLSQILLVGVVTQISYVVAGRIGLALQVGTWALIALLAGLLALVALIVCVERAQRRLLVQYPKRKVGDRVYPGEASLLPLKLNSAGLAPPVQALSLLTCLVVGAEYIRSLGWSSEPLGSLVAWLGPGQPLHLVLYVWLIVVFTFFGTAVAFDVQGTADALRRQGRFLPGIRPGARTAEFLDYVLSRITVLGAIYLVVLCVLPDWLVAYGVPFYFAGPALVVTVNVTMNVVAEIQQRLLAHQYEGLIRKAKLRGATRRR